jgi:hypothetical protein
MWMRRAAIEFATTALCLQNAARTFRSSFNTKFFRQFRRISSLNFEEIRRSTLLQVNRKSHLEIQSLARLTQGILSFNTDQTILTLPPSDSNGQASIHKQRQDPQEHSFRQGLKWA